MKISKPETKLESVVVGENPILAELGIDWEHLLLKILIPAVIIATCKLQKPTPIHDNWLPVHEMMHFLGALYTK